MTYLVAIPIFNEQSTIGPVLEKVLRLVPDVLVVDDGSTDATPDILSAFPSVHVITHPENRGYGQSLIDSFQFAADRKFDWVITMDCDEQHEPEFIQRFVDRFPDTQADIISGSRYLKEFDSDDEPPADRRQINMTINSLLRQILQLDLTDSFCGFKAHRVSALQRLSLTEPGYAFPCQFWVQCVRAGLRIEELSVRRIYLDRNR
ncbi:MAG: glycosyltransferase family 2 protein, partial [Phycisphaerae bacterium]